MSTVYAVFQMGVYRHDCGGVFSTPEGAKARADALARRERDNYHSFDVVPFELDEISDYTASHAFGTLDTIHVLENDPIYTVSRDHLVPRET